MVSANIVLVLLQIADTFPFSVVLQSFEWQKQNPKLSHLVLFLLLKKLHCLPLECDEGKCFVHSSLP